MVVLSSDLRSACHILSSSPVRSDPRPESFRGGAIGLFRHRVGSPLRLKKALYGVARKAVKKATEKPTICTADELHYVPVSNSDWKLALWRYTPSPKAPQRNHPLLLLSGVGTNAIGYDLSPESSFARYMSGQGFDTWILEVRGAGLSAPGIDFRAAKNTLNDMSESDISFIKGKKTEMVSTISESQIAGKLVETIENFSEKLSSFLDEGLLESSPNFAIGSQIRDLSRRLVNMIEEGQQSVSPFDLQDCFSATIEDLQKQLDLIVKYDWDFDHHLEEDVPAAMEHIRNECKPKDGKLLAIGHSMGGILLYAMLSRHSFKGRESGLTSVTTLGSSLDYTTSKSSAKLFLPLVDPAQVLKVPVVPLGALLAAAYPLASRPPYVLSWLNPQISAQDMMHPKLIEKLVFNNFCTVPAKVFLQLTSAFRKGGLCDRSGTFFYKDHLRKGNVPILALAGDQDLICPPDAVYETVKLIPEHLITYKVFGEPSGPHYAHYDLVGARLAADQVYPCIIEFLSCHDMS